MRRRTDITATIHLFHDAENLKAYADVSIQSKVGEITLRRFKVIQSPSGKLWVALPQFEFKNLFKSKYIDSIIVTKRAIRRIQRVVLRMYHEKVYEQNPHVRVDHS